jgi:hypothetical protein
MTHPDDTLLEAILARPHLVARIVALHAPPAPPRVKPRGSKLPALGATAKQRAAFLRLSPERQAHVTAWEAWRAAWKLWHYFGAAHPGPEPIDTTSPEAIDMARRIADLDAMQLDAEYRLSVRWGGDIVARDIALRESQKIFRSRYASDEDHAAAVRAFLDAESDIARKAAMARAQASPAGV